MASAAQEETPQKPQHELLPAAEPLHMQWEWCADSFLWSPYSLSTSAAIEAAFQSGKPSIDFRVADSCYTVHFQPAEPRQKNLATGQTRPVKRQALTEGTGASWLWWEKETQRWHLYDTELAAQIEEIWKENSLSRTIRRQKAPGGLFFVIHGQAYNIEFETDAVQYNLKTRFARGVRRNPCSENPHLLCEGGVASNALDVGSRGQGKRHRHGPSSSSPPPTLPSGNDASYHSVHPRASSSGCNGGDMIRGPSYNSADVEDLANPSHTEHCSICLSDLQEKRAAILVKCKHSFHRECIESWFKSRPTCPECLTVYGTIIGTQPHGEMHVRYITYGSMDAKFGLAGYPNTDVIKIMYKFPSGIQTAEHPNPGRPYSGTVRIAYLPKNKDGEEVLELLKKAWERRLLFRVGTSVTTGQNNVITWSGIHLKTQMSGGSSNHGYPDETYFSRVKKELEDAGVM